MLLKRSAGSEGDKADVQKFFGYIGLFTLLGFWWLGKMTDKLYDIFPWIVANLYGSGEKYFELE